MKILDPVAEAPGRGIYAAAYEAARVAAPRWVPVETSSAEEATRIEKAFRQKKSTFDVRKNGLTIYLRVKA